ncbi:MAG: hypothetical protein ACI8UD_001046 [Planctomycetota bacterium]|jgi:hypothetical protein
MTSLPTPFSGMRNLAFLLLLPVLSLVSCAGSRYGFTPESSVASLDDVTNGLVNNASRGQGNGGTADSMANPLAGAFFNDGGDGDIRARSENYFLSADDDGLVDSTSSASGSSATMIDSDGDGLPDQRVSTAPKKVRMLIYSGQVRVEVARAEDAAKAFLAKVEEWGGYLQQQAGTTVTVRVPAKHFDEAFAAVRDAGRVLSESRKAKDVTEEFVDLGIRVDNARRSRDRLLEVLKLAKEVEDILRVEKELRRLTEEIERMEGRLKFLRDQVSLSTLQAQFQSVAEAPTVRRQRQRSRFGWINRIGADAVMEGF